MKLERNCQLRSVRNVECGSALWKNHNWRKYNCCHSVMWPRSFAGQWWRYKSTKVAQEALVAPFTDTVSSLFCWTIPPALIYSHDVGSCLDSSDGLVVAQTWDWNPWCGWIEPLCRHFLNWRITDTIIIITWKHKKIVSKTKSVKLRKFQSRRHQKLQRKNLVSSTWQKLPKNSRGQIEKSNVEMSRELNRDKSDKICRKIAEDRSKNPMLKWTGS